jgi:hypothetical protein
VYSLPAPTSLTGLSFFLFNNALDIEYMAGSLMNLGHLEVAGKNEYVLGENLLQHYTAHHIYAFMLCLVDPYL